MPRGLKFLDDALSKLRNTITIWLILLLGLVTYLIGFTLRGVHVINLNIGEVVSHVGFLIGIIALFHWLVEYKTLKYVINQILTLNISSQEVAASGIVDFKPNSKEVDYVDMIKNSKRLIICLHYSPRFLDDYYTQLSSRKRRFRPLIFLTLKENGKSLEYLRTIRHESDHIVPNMKKIRSLVLNLKNDGLKIELVEHDSVLRYSFVMGDDDIWVKFYKNAIGKSDVPAMRVTRGTPLFEFFEKDVKEMIKLPLDSQND